MAEKTKQEFIREKAHQNQDDPEGAKILWSRHGTTELANEGWTRIPVETALQECEVIEDYPEVHRPLPDCLVLAYFEDRRPLHVVIAIDEQNDRLIIVTVYQPNSEEWNDDWRTRKTK